VLYLAAVEVLFSRMIVGWAMTDSMTSRLVVDAMEIAIHRRLPGAGLIAHSDRGSQHASDRRGAEMFRGDLETAGNPNAVEGPDGPLFADFHSLRHSYLTPGSQAGIDLRTLQELGGHSTSTLTVRNSHRRFYDLAGAVEKMSYFLPGQEIANEAAALLATGTGGQADDSLLPASCTNA
jgi:hypothetical protein